MRITSIEAYREAKYSGLINLREMQVLEDVWEWKFTTANESWNRIRAENPNIQLSSITPRFCTLVRKGVLQEMEPRKCLVTGHRCITYCATGEEPHKPEKRPKAKTKQELQAEIAKLQTVICRSYQELTGQPLYPLVEVAVEGLEGICFKVRNKPVIEL